VTGTPALAGQPAACHFCNMLWRSGRPIKRPGTIEPCIPTRASRPPVGHEWIHEIKHDGYRLIARKQDDRVRLFTRRGYDWTDRYPLIRKAVAAIQTASAVIDGEAVCCDDAGVAIFDQLHSRAYDDQVFLYAFDLLELDGEDWRPRPLGRRRGHLRARLQARSRGHRFQACGFRLSIRPEQSLVQDQESIFPRCFAVQGPVALPGQRLAGVFGRLE
jgi:ATP-dependent DNA ligase